MTVATTPLRDLQAFLSVARLLPLEQRIAIVKEVLTLLEAGPAEPPAPDLVTAGWQAAAAAAIEQMRRRG